MTYITYKEIKDTQKQKKTKKWKKIKGKECALRSHRELCHTGCLASCGSKVGRGQLLIKDEGGRVNPGPVPSSSQGQHIETKVCKEKGFRATTPTEPAKCSQVPPSSI